MSYMHAGRLFATYPGGAVERGVLVALSLFMSYEIPTQPVYPSLEKLALIVGYSPRRVRYALRILEHEGWILAAGSRIGGAGKATNYRINVARLDAYPDRTKRPREPADRANPASDADLNPAPPAAFVDEPCTERPPTRHRTTLNAARHAAEQGFEQGIEQGTPTPDSKVRGSFDRTKIKNTRIPSVSDHAGLDGLAREWKVTVTPYDGYPELRNRLFARRQELLLEMFH